MKKKRLTQKIALYGVLTTIAMMLSYLEALVPLSVAVPGIKIGLANIAVVFALYSLGTAAACSVSGVRVLLLALLFGNVMTFAYSVSGAVLSLAVMAALEHSGKFGCIGVSVAGGIAHNGGQILCAALLLGTRQILYYLPVLIVSGTVAGVVVGLLAGVLHTRLAHMAQQRRT